MGKYSLIIQAIFFFFLAFTVRKMYLKFFPKEVNLRLFEESALDSTMSKEEVYTKIDQIIYAINKSFGGTSTKFLYEVTELIDFSDWAKINKLYGKKKYALDYGEVYTSYLGHFISYFFVTKKDLLFTLKNELSNDKDSDAYWHIKNLYAGININDF